MANFKGFYDIEDLGFDYELIVGFTKDGPRHLATGFVRFVDAAGLWLAMKAGGYELEDVRNDLSEFHGIAIHFRPHPE